MEQITLLVNQLAETTNKEVQGGERYWILRWIDDFLTAPTMVQASKGEDCEEASAYLRRLLHLLGVKRHPYK